MILRIPGGNTGLVDWLAMNTTAKVYKDKDLQTGKNRENSYFVDTEGGLWAIKYVGQGKQANWRRFIPVGDAKEMDKLNTLVEEKNLSRADLYTVLKAIKLNPKFDGQEDIFQ